MLLALSASLAHAERPLLLWDVTKGKVHSTLLGTCHIPIPLAHALPAPHEARLRDARVVVTELGANLDPRAFLRTAWDPAADLRAALGEDAFRAVSVRARGTIPAPMLRHMSPWVAGTGLAVGSPPGLALDSAVTRAAREAGVPVIGLETIDEQLALTTGMDEYYVRALTPGSREGRALAKGAVDTIDACLEGDAGALEHMVRRDRRDPRQRALLDDRNAAWRQRLVAEAERGRLFVAVGAAHLVGPSGIVAALEEEGFAVTPLTTDAPAAVDASGFTPFEPLEPVEADTDAVEMWTGVLAVGIGAACADGSSIRECWTPDAATCAARLRANAALCAEQHTGALPSIVGATPEALEPLGQCVFAPLAMEAIALDQVNDTPACQEQREGMLSRVAAALGG